MIPVAIAIALATFDPSMPVSLPAAYTESPSTAEWIALDPRSPQNRSERVDPATFSYTYFEVGAIRLDVEKFDDKADIYYGRASIGLLNFLYLFGEYQNQSTDFQNTDTDLFELGAGVHGALAPNVDLFGEVGWLYSDVSSGFAALDDTTTGYRLFGGIRWMVMPWSDGGLELDGGVGYTDLSNRFASKDKVMDWDVGARVHFLKFMSVGAGYTKFEDDDQVSANVRFSF